mgnify:CR=1 FL=1
MTPSKQSIKCSPVMPDQAPVPTKFWTLRQRVLAAIEHRQPDQVPCDLGSNRSFGISAMAYNRLKAYLGLTQGATRVFDVVQQLAQPEACILDFMGADVLDVGRVFNVHAARERSGRHQPLGRGRRRSASVACLAQRLGRQLQAPRPPKHHGGVCVPGRQDQESDCDTYRAFDRCEILTGLVQKPCGIQFLVARFQNFNVN